MSLTFLKALKTSESILKNAGSPAASEALIEAELLLMRAFYIATGQKISRLDLYEKRFEVFPMDAWKILSSWSESRAKGSILQHLTGVQYFHEHEYQVGPEVLVPRPETEVLLEATFEAIQERSRLRKIKKGIEIGIGSGILCIELLAKFPDLRMIGTEVSSGALTIARSNASQVLGESAHRLVSLLVRPLDPIFGRALEAALAETTPSQKADFIISNPPYLTRSDEMAQDVAAHEPAVALFAPESDPLYFYREISKSGAGFLNQGGFIAVEVPHERAFPIRDLFEADRWSHVRLLRDLSGRDRVLVADIQ